MFEKSRSLSCADALEQASVGAPITRAGVSLFPVYLAQSPPAGIVGAAPGTVEISEAEAASVPTLSVRNLIDRTVLLAAGETFAGGLQHRTLNVSVLLPPKARLDVPVSCVEAGRWGGERRFEGTAGQVSRRVRRTTVAGVADNLHRGAAKRADQSAVWASVDHELDRLGVDSPTRSLMASEVVFARREVIAGASSELSAAGALPGQCGVVVSHGSRVVAAELFGTPELLAAHWASVVRAAVLDVPDEPRGRPSASKALRFLRRFATGSAVEADGVGLGIERHVRSGRLTGQILSLDDAVVHACGFATAA